MAAPEGTGKSATATGATAPVAVFVVSSQGRPVDEPPERHATSIASSAFVAEVHQAVGRLDGRRPILMVRARRPIGHDQLELGAQGLDHAMSGRGTNAEAQAFELVLEVREVHGRH